MVMGVAVMVRTVMYQPEDQGLIRVYKGSCTNVILGIASIRIAMVVGVLDGS